MEKKKTQIWNLIILDESGSMGSLTEQTISGCNETIDTIKRAAEENKNNQEHFISIYAFDDRNARYIIREAVAEDVKYISFKDYHPYGMTPLLDSVGTTLTDLKNHVSDVNGTALVTIITDGYENASKEWTWDGVQKFIKELKEEGWVFTFIGANIDVEKVSEQLGIDSTNSYAFTHDAVGTATMFCTENTARMDYFKSLSDIDANIDNLGITDENEISNIKKSSYSKLNSNYFKKKK